MRRGEREDDGVFDRGSTFDRGEERQGPADNPPIIRQEDQARGVPAAELAAGRNTAPSMTDQKLVAVWDAQGNPQVARTINNRQQEQFHPPSPEEWELLKARGYFARGGLSDVAPATPTTPAAPAAGEGFPWKKAAAVLGAVGALWAWKNWDTVQDWYVAVFGQPEGEEEVME